MSPRKKAHAAFIAAVVLLFLSGFAGYLTITRLLQSARLVAHTQEVRAALGDIDAAVLQAGRARNAYIVSGSTDFSTDFEAANRQITRSLAHLRELTRDNPAQQANCSRLEAVMSRRVALQEVLIARKKNGKWDQTAEADFQQQNVPLSSEMIAVMQQMSGEEQSLLMIREHQTNRLFRLAIFILVVTFLLSLVLLAVHYKFLWTELDARAEAERSARDSAESLRRLTGRLLQLQDAERRKFSRELHDSLGQYLAGAKMNLEMYAAQRNETLLMEALQLLDHSIGETRTISHLLHPPLLDEAGLASAVRWYLEGFAQRSGIQVKVSLPDDASQLPRPVALGLFRVLQEGLTNIHRHSGSKQAEVSVEMLANRVTLRVRDYGKGISPDLLLAFRAHGTNSGVGLAGMRERIHELGGQMNIEPALPGTLVSVVLPYSPVTNASAISAAD
jgi:signal transduction histidine kinase